jgi:hypothetical protein
MWADPTHQPSPSLREWESLLGQARQAGLQGRLAHHFLANGWLDQVPPGPQVHLQSALRLAERQWHEVTWEARCIRRALSAIDTPIVVLKGAAYLLANLPAARGRIFSDIDLMVSRQAIDAVEDALFAAGWISEERNPYNIRYYREWMHEIPPVRHVHRGTTIDLHHTITPPTSRFKVDGADLLSRIQPIPGQPGLYTLHPVDMVLHSAAHLFMEGDFGRGLRDLLDLNDLVIHFSRAPGFWDELLDRATHLGLQIPLSHALIHLNRLFSTAPPQRLEQQVQSLDRSTMSRHVMSSLLGLALRPDHPHCDGPYTGLARWLLYVRSHHLRMPMYLAMPHLVRKAFMRLKKKQPEEAR